MPVTHPHFSTASSEDIPRSGLSGSTDSESFCLDQTIETRRGTSRKFSHYELLEAIGDGQFGTVWRANDQRLNRIVALKLPHLTDFDEQRRTLFLREARAAAFLEHPNIVQVHGVELDGDQPGIISQFIEGQTLYQLLQHQRPGFAETARILATVADAVHHAHEAGVIHRDLKPSNILMDVEGQPHVSDFGLAKWIGDQAMLTNPGVVVGTPAYMSPEQARGDSHLVDRRSDVYSLGVLLYELLTGKPPFEGNSTLLLHQIQSQDPRAPRAHDNTIPLDLETICLKCLAKSPSERYASAQELADDLQRYLANEPICARSITFAERCVRWTRRNPTLASLVAISILSTFSAIGLGVSLLGAAIPNPKAMEFAATNPVPPVSAPLNVTLPTEPEGATVVFYPLDAATGEPVISRAVRPEEKSPVSLTLPSGDYLIVTALPDGRFHEVYRHVPRDANMTPRFYPHCLWTRTSPNSVSLYPVTIPPLRDEPEMSLLADGPPNQRSQTTPAIKPFLLDKREFTVGESLPIFGNYLPPSLRGHKELLSSLDLPVTGLFFDEAMACAELSGKRLPTATEYEFAATNGWTTLFPWGDTEPPPEAWQLSKGYKAFDETRTSSPVYGLFSNAAEFVYSGELRPFGNALMEPGTDTKVLVFPYEMQCAIVRGGPISKETKLEELRSQGARWKVGTTRTLLSPSVGFRCAKSKSPRL